MEDLRKSIGNHYKWFLFAFLASIVLGIFIGRGISAVFFEEPFFPGRVRVIGKSPCPDFEQWLNRNVASGWDSHVVWDHKVNVTAKLEPGGQTAIYWDPNDSGYKRFDIFINIREGMPCEDSKAVALKEIIGTRGTLEWWIANQGYLPITNPEWLTLVDGLSIEYVLSDRKGLTTFNVLEPLFLPWDGISDPTCEQLLPIYLVAKNNVVIRPGGSIESVYGRCQ